MTKVFRYCSEKEVIKLLRDKKLLPSDYTYISLTLNDENVEDKIFLSAEGDHDYKVTYSLEKLRKQNINLIVVEYTQHYFYLFPQIFQHIVSYSYETINDYAEDFEEEHPGVWETLSTKEKWQKYWNYAIDIFKHEEEVLIKSITLESGLILNIEKTDNSKVSDKIIKLLNQLIKK